MENIQIITCITEGDIANFFQLSGQVLKLNNLACIQSMAF